MATVCRPIFPWNQNAASRGVGVRTSLSKKKDAILTIAQKDAGASVLDMAGKKSSNRLGNALNAFGAPSRVMWRAYEQHSGQVESEMKQSVDQVMAQISQLTKALVL